MSSFAFTQQNGSGIPSQAWLQDSVRTFFETLAWDGRQLIPVTSSLDSVSSSAESAMTMRVGSFFSSIPWEGQPTIAAPVAPLEMQVEMEKPSGDSLTLDAFSDLF